MKKIVIGLSGGMDSATLLGSLLEEGHQINACTFTYGSKHNQYETEAAFNLVNFYQKKGMSVNPFFFNLEETFKNFESNLLKSGGEIPEGHYESENMKLTVVPGRNLIFASIMAGLAESIGAEVIALGVHAGDHAIYPDCRPLFISHLRNVLFASTDGKVDVITPFLGKTKIDIVRIGQELEVPFEITRTCYKDSPIACGRCGSCQERLEAFNLNNLLDPIQYE